MHAFIIPCFVCTVSFSLLHTLISLSDRVSHQAGLGSDAAHQKMILQPVKQQMSSLQLHAESPLPSRTGTTIQPVPSLLIGKIH